ncbi:OmpA family lipoprotein [Utexia brackfieldae]|uniref:OmpA family lipoprotein n=1 Tax=Utexia brackfieldae TaxID=3074108 RepID=UPI00370D9CF4
MKIPALIISVFSAVLILSGCTTDPYSGESQAAKTGTGAAIGSLVGAGIGVLASSKSDRGKGALIGAASGAALGGGIGAYMDAQESKLRNQLRGSGVSVTRNGNNVILNMPNSVTFDTNSSVLKPAGANTLMSVALVLKEYNKTAINITGHTDSTGSVATNQRLSLERANSVANMLIQQNVAAGRMYTYGAGSTQPIASNSNESGRAENRRVEITLSPLQ